MRHTRARITITAAAAAVALVAVGGSASAATSDVIVSGGNLTMTAPTVGSFTGVTLGGTTAKTTTAALGAFSVDDATGTGSGWKVSAQGTQFKEIDINGAYVASGKTLPTGSLKLSAPTVTADGTTSAAPSITAGPYTLDAVAAGSAVKIASAAVDTGMGKYNFSATTMTLSVPVSAYAKTYRSDVTVTLATAP